MDESRPWSPLSDGHDEKVSSSSVSWGVAEETTQDIVMKVQATTVSEERRKAVVDYVQRLIRNSTCCEVFPFGSVPLKTYLPDGDIDLTAVNSMNIDEEAVANDVYNILEREDRSHATEFIVKDVQLIRAEVKLVKCLVQNIVVDISFNQLGGLSTLCFLEKVSHRIGKNHLFKRSIILIKAWCYYESRVLGAHHGLISTYALETLVLYIFNLFHSSLNGPLAVLFKFLEHFSRFDWEKYCISLNGPVLIASLPQVVIERPENAECDLLLSGDFIKECVEDFSVPVRGLEANSRIFSLKYLNIVDPLRDSNNLGRSVSKGNFFRIKSAFTYGARKLGHILSLPEALIGDEVRKFFSNTLDRHGRGQRPDAQDSASFDQSSAVFPTIDPIHGNMIGSKEYENQNYKNSDLNVSSKNSVKNPIFSRLNLEELRISDNCGASELSTPAMQYYVSPNQYFYNSSLENGENTSRKLEMEHSSEMFKNDIPTRSSSGDNGENLSSANMKNNSEEFNSLSNLKGDYTSHVNNLHISRHLLECSLKPSSPGFYSPPPKTSWDTQILSPTNGSLRNSNIFRRSVVYLNSPLLVGSPFGEEITKPRGTGTYIPNMHHYKEKSISLRGKLASERSPRRSAETLQSPSSIQKNGGRSATSDVNGVSHLSPRGLEFGSFSEESLRDKHPVSDHKLGTSKTKHGSSQESDRIDDQMYHLKDEGDFPPLADSNAKGFGFVSHEKR